jgi:uncharacterized protein Yka (UPF0111/DUF47 family)
MDPTVVKTLITLGTYGPLGVMAALGFMLFLLERKKTSELTEKLLEFAQASVKADSEHNKAMEALGKLYDVSADSMSALKDNTATLGTIKESLDRLEAKNERKR